MATDATRAEEAKQLGNAMFSKGKMQAAIDAYSEAICFDPNEPVYYTNRAMCHRRKESWEAVIADCRTALLLDDASIKGHYLLGVALDAGGEFEPAVQHLFRALELCKDRTVAYKEDIQRAMLLTRKRQWQANAPSSDAQVATASRVLTQLVSSHYEAALAGSRQHAPQQLAELQDEASTVQASVQEALEALRASRGPGRVPDCYCCKITMEIMLDPVTTPDGITYEKSAMLEHLKKVGRFDPITRRDIDASQLVPNLGLKEAINAFLDANPWAYDSPM